MNKSKQRDVVYDVLCGTVSHPTADWIYDEARQVLPEISRGTVYRNLKELQGAGKLIKVEGIFEKDRYDADTSLHAHLVCRECGSVVDFTPIDMENVFQIGQLDGACVENYSLVYHGLCFDCNNKN